MSQKESKIVKAAPAVLIPKKSGGGRSRGSRAPTGYNPPVQSVMQNSTFYAIVETTEGTLPAYAGTDAVAMRTDGVAYNTNRELLEPGYMTSSWSKTAPSAGAVSDDTGCTLPVWARGKGSASQIDFHYPMKAAMGSEVQSTSGTVAAAPAPTATGFTIDGGGAVVVGDIIKVNGEYTRILTESTGAVTFFPPLSAVPVATDAVTVDYTYKCLSDNTSFITYSGIFEFDGPRRLEFLGCRNGFTMNFEVGQRCSIDFNVIANNYNAAYAAATTPTIDTDTDPPVCLGMDLSAWYVGTVGAGATTTVIPVVSDPEIDLQAGDFLVVDVGSGVFETAVIASVSGLSVTVAALGGAPSEGDTLYIKRVACAGIGDTLGITLEMTSERSRCMAAPSGTKSQFYTGRTVTVNKTPYFDSWYELLSRDAVVGAELWVVLGDTANNIMVVNMPNVINQGVSLGTDQLMKYSVDALAVRDTVDNDELFIAFM